MSTLPQEVHLPLEPAEAIAVIVYVTRTYPLFFEWQGVLVHPDNPNRNTFQFHLPGGAKVYSSSQGRNWYVYCMNSTYTLSNTLIWLREEVGLDVKCTAPAVRTMGLPDFSKNPSILRLQEQMGISND